MRDVAHVYDLDDAPRLVYRSRFIFLLLIAVANLALSATTPKTWAARLGSSILLIAPFPLAAAFLLDPARGAHGSALSGYTLRAVFVAALLLAFAYRKGRE
jgi:hypothetical protein